MNDKDNVDIKKIDLKVKQIKKSHALSNEAKILIEYSEMSAKLKEYAKLVKDLNAGLEEMVKEKYGKLTDSEIKELLVNKKWYYSIFKGISDLYVTTSHKLANRIVELTERYEDTLPSLEKEVEDYEAKVKSHLERMGFAW